MSAKKPPDELWISLTQGLSCVIHASSFAVVSPYKWRAFTRKADKKAYVITSKYCLETKTKETIYMHRLLVGARPGEEVDHINGNGLDNRISNLRICTRQQNCSNLLKQATYAGKPTKNTYKGTYFERRTNKWCARIYVSGRRISLGTFHTPEDAARAYNIAAQKHFGSFSNQNLIVEPAKPKRKRK